MQVISFKNTALFKRGIWLSAAVLLVFVAAPAALDGRLWKDPLPSVFVVAMLCVLMGVFFWRTQIHRLADEVLDCQDHLKIRRGRIEQGIAFSGIATAAVSSSGGFRRITLTLRESVSFGSKIEFLPRASLWSNPVAIERAAAVLNERANQARRASTRPVD
ncbi:MAG TPA: hypothetical protein VGH12_08475 [Steroidobacteraceae bacterium]